MGRSVLFCGLLLLASCAIAPSTPGKLSLSPVGYDDLPGWNNDKIGEVKPTLMRSCSVLTQKAKTAAPDIAGRAADWAQPCAFLAALPPADDAETRAFFEQWFQPYAVNDGDGFFTGYYEAELHGAKHRHGRYQIPLYTRPHDLVLVNLGLFRPMWKGNHITGKIKGNALVPYDDREMIANGSLTHRGKVLLWVDDPVDAFYLSVQGSGRVRMENGSTVRLGYDGANGQPYVSIGALMADGGMLQRPVTMQSIRAWLTAHSDQAQTVMNGNPNYVFFRIMKGDGPLGSEGVALTPGRSLAVDSSYVPLGLPLWLDTIDAHGAPLRRAVVAQDTGGAIKGPVRGDFFWGFGKDAEAQAGAMQTHGTYYILLPRTVTPNAE